MSAVSQTAAAPAVRISLLALARRLALPFVFVLSCAFQYAQGRAHVTTTVFDDELLYQKVAQSFAAGHWELIRGVRYAFPAFVAPLVQAPAWLLGSTLDGYAAAKLINAVVMSSAVFPAYWLARGLVRRSFALAVAAATVATPAMVYHAYLMSEAAAYPVFVLAVVVLVRAAAEPSRRFGVAVPAVCVLAAATRVQFVVLPLAYVAAVVLCRRVRRSVLPLGLLAGLGVAFALVPGALGTYGNAGSYTYGGGAVAHWAVTNVSLLPYSLGLAVVPGALVGLTHAAVRPRRAAERAFAVVTAMVVALFVGQAALISAGEAHRPLERYLFYVTPLVFLAFFHYVERGAPRRLAYVCVAAVVAVALSQVSLAGMTGTAGFFFDSATESAYARAAFRLGISDASLLFSLAPLVLCALAAALPLRRASVALAAAGAAVAVQIAAGNAFASTDHLVTQWAQRTFAASPPNWLDRAHLGPARYVVLPNANPFLGTSLETWNRSVRGLVVLETPAPDPYGHDVARVRDDGTLVIGERRARPQLLVVNASSSQIGWDARVVARPRVGIVAYRLERGAHVHWLAKGLAPDRWMGDRLRYRVWRRGSRRGRYVVELELPRGFATRPVQLAVDGGAKRTVTLRPGEEKRVVLPAPGTPVPVLRVAVAMPPAPVGSRPYGARVLVLRYVR